MVILVLPTKIHWNWQKRDDNSDLTWSQEIAVLNTTANTLTLTGQTGTEYILATGGDNPLPIELISFQAELLKDETVELTWITSSEINNDYFTIERSVDRTSWEIFDKVKGAGNSEQQTSYSTIDSFPYNGVTYYRLKQTDFDGQYKYFDVRKIALDILRESHIRIFPNPVENKTILRGNNKEIEKIEVYNALGQEVTGNIEILERNKSELLLDLSNLRRGIFYVKTKSTINRVYKR
ncbi:MAG: T9SS type A sorting domain-containing protein [Reichenbachiella sp.]|uniref:T9SS type A sorting domain-containing protein n=1 Tax=Reichenbachiella sp. TaxID=2184521 RepID=UPI003264FA52